MQKIDMIGRKFGKLTVIGPAKSHGTKAYWMCLCECGTVKEIRGQLLRSGRAQSCGCGRGFKHGFCTDGRPKRIYNIWRDMRSRCQNPKNIGFKLYGGRGISVCKEWEDFQTFQKWASSAGYSDDLTLDRKDPDGDYSPGNCRWISNDEQQRNRRNNVQITINGETKCLAEWARTIGRQPQYLNKVRAKGRSLEEFVASELKKKEALGDACS